MTLSPVTSPRIGRKSSQQVLVGAFLKARTPETFEPLVTGNITMVRRIIYRIVLCPDDTEDLVQETFIRAYEKAAAFEGKSKFSTWLCGIGVNLAISFIRKQKRRQSDELPPELEELNPSSPHGELETSQELNRIHAGIAKLPEKFRAVIVLGIVEELPPKEVADILGCSQATVYWRLHQARKRLAQILEVEK